jgi:hypothetical protein
MSSLMGTTDFDALFKVNFNYSTQMVLFAGIFLAFAVKTPIIFLNNWLLKAHVESPLSGSIVLAAIVLKLSLYGCCRLILPIIPQASLVFTPFVFMISVITIIYASLSTLRAIDIKELIAYSSVCHAAVYLMGVFSNSVNGIEGSIVLGIAHGFVSSALFICVGGVLYDRAHSRLITYYRGIASIMPLFSLLFFVFCLGNSGAPLTLNFVGEFLSLYGAFERLPILGVLACSSIIFSAAYTIYMYNRIVFGGSLSAHFSVNIPDLNKREFVMLLALVIPTVLLGIYPSPILDGLHYSVSTLIYFFNEVDFQPLSPTVLLGLSLVSEYKSDIKDLYPELEDLDPEFITGFIDGEGCFELSIMKDNRNPKETRYGYSLCFTIGLHERDKALLMRIQKYFAGVGTITKLGKNAVRYRISSLNSLALVIAHFDKYPLITQKQADYLLFKAAYDLICSGAHLTETGFVSLLALKASINKGFTGKLNKVYSNIVPADRPLVQGGIRSPQWIAGFTTGEGCFIVNIYKGTTVTGYKVMLRFKIAQSTRDAKLMKSLSTYLDCGGWQPEEKKNEGQFVVSKFSDNFEKIIPLFNKYPIQGVKALDFADWCRAALVIKEGRHLTEEGLEEIREIKAGMNKGREL